MVLDVRFQLVVDIRVCTRPVNIRRKTSTAVEHSKAGHSRSKASSIVGAKNNVLVNTYLLSALTPKRQVQSVVGSAVGVHIQNNYGLLAKLDPSVVAI